MAERWSADQSRKILRRIVVEGELVLQTPAHFGNGEDSDLTDMPLLVDPYDGKSPLLQGTSLAGALRNYLLYCELGDDLIKALPDNERDRQRVQEAIQQQINLSKTVKLFGTDKRGEGVQSALIVEDALGQNYATETRDGVGIDPQSRTAAEDKLYDTQYWQAGTTFPLRFELIIDEHNIDYAETLQQALATALYGLETGEITLGMRKHRGFGQVSVNGWRVRNYHMTEATDIAEWVLDGNKPLPNTIPLGRMNEKALGVDLLLDNRTRFVLDAEFSVPHSMLIRTARTAYLEDAATDMAHLYSYRDGSNKPVPIISGTALAGVLRARARKIAGLFRKADLIDNLFGDDVEATQQQILSNGDKKPIRASRLRTFEAEIKDGETDLIQNRVKIDRFTGGAFPTALFNQKPLFGNRQAWVRLQINIVSPQDAEIGLLLLLLKDLWTEDLSIGGELSVGRGRLMGRNAKLRLDSPDTSWSIVIEQASDGHLETSPDATGLEYYVEQFCEGS